MNRTKEEYNEYMKLYVANRFVKLKLRAIEYKGGKCQKCKYNECYAAMDFHHRDPNEKDVSWSKLRKRSWEKIVKELDKCDLLCNRCHSETHHGIEIEQRVREWMKFERTSTLEKEGICFCGKPFVRTWDTKNKKFCSPKCSRLNRTVGNWPKDKELIKMTKTESLSSLGRKIGVSGNAVKKRLLRLERWKQN